MPLFRRGYPSAGCRQAPHPALEPERIVELLGPHLSRERRSRIERVIARRLLGVTVVLERPYDPHNGAAVLRSAEALGLLDVHVIEGDTAFAFSKKVTISAHKWLNVYVHQNTERCLSGLRQAGYRLLAALPPLATTNSAPALPAAVEPARSSWQPLALVFGNEHAGLTNEAIGSCDGPLHLPMYGFSESYNLSVSVAMALFAVTTERRRLLQRDGDLSLAQRSHLRAAYYARSTRHALALLEKVIKDK